MYDLPWLQAANDRLWAAIRDRLREAGLGGVPEGLDRARPLDTIWHDPALLLGHTCGYPLRTRLDGVVRLVATPVYASPFHRRRVSPQRHRRRPWGAVAEPRGSPRPRRRGERLRQQHGMNLFRLAVAPLVEVAGGGRSSAGDRDRRASGEPRGGRRRQRGRRRDRRRDLRPRPASPPGPSRHHRGADDDADEPGLPFVTAASASDGQVAALQAALEAVVADPALADVRRDLCLTGIERLDRPSTTAC